MNESINQSTAFVLKAVSPKEFFRRFSPFMLPLPELNVGKSSRLQRTKVKNPQGQDRLARAGSSYPRADAARTTIP